jgi:hypothetical protein
MKDFCLICPIYPPDYKYGQHLYYQSIIYNIDLCFIFTTKADKNLFFKVALKGEAPKFIFYVLEDEYSAIFLETIEEKKVFPTFKKFFALDKLQSEYRYLNCIDSELILLDNSWTEVCDRIFKRKVWYGGFIKPEMGFIKEIVFSSATELIPEKDHEALRKWTNDYTCYSWWWDIPVYKSIHINDFLCWIGWNDKDGFLRKLSWNAFDHLIYQYFTVLYCDFKLQCIDSVVRSLEFSDIETYKRITQQYDEPSWINCHAFLQDPDFVLKSNTFMAIFHLDRVTEYDKNIQTASYFKRVYRELKILARCILNI